MSCFVYRWTDHATGKYYVGVHKGSEDDGYICSSKVMMREYRERPLDFTREIIVRFDDYGIARQAEINMLMEVNAAANTCYYNRSNGGSENFKKEGQNSPECRKKISRANKGKKKPPFSEEHRKNLSKAHTGRIVTDETRVKMSAAQKARVRPKEHGEKISRSKMGYKHTEETKRKIGNAHRGRTHSMEYKQRMSEKLKGRVLSAEWKQKISASRRKNHVR